jgi:hypothetical protein
MVRHTDIGGEAVRSESWALGYAQKEVGIMRRIVALVSLVFAIAALAATTLATTSRTAEADAPCSGGSHWHQHWPLHRDYWHDHGWFERDGEVYRRYHIHQHGDYRETLCT